MKDPLRLQEMKLHREAQKTQAVMQPLLERARVRGFVTVTEIVEAFPEEERHTERINDFFLCLFTEDVEVVNDALPENEAANLPIVPSFFTDDSPEPTNAQLDLCDIASDDTISLYMGEMGRVALLTSDEEKDLARQIGDVYCVELDDA